MLLLIVFIKICMFFILLPLGSALDSESGNFGIAGIVGNASFGTAGIDAAVLLNQHMLDGFQAMSRENESVVSTPTTDSKDICPDDGSLFDSLLAGVSTALLIILLWHIVRICCMEKSKSPSPSRAPIPNNSAVADISVTKMKSQTINLNSARSTGGTTSQ